MIHVLSFTNKSIKKILEIRPQKLNPLLIQTANQSITKERIRK